VPGIRVEEKGGVMLEECPDTLDHTTGCMIDECDRKYYWFKIRGIRALYEKDYFIAGKAWDRALKVINQAELEPAVRVQKAFQTIRQTYSRAKCDFIGEKRSAENVILLLNKFIDTYGFYPKYKVLASNVPFRFPYKDFFIGGELDAYLDWSGLGVVYDENKTTAGKITDPYLANFYLGAYAQQLNIYNWACRQVTENLWGSQVTVACLDIPKRESTKRVLFQRLLIQPHELHIIETLNTFERRMERLRENWRQNSWPMKGQHCEGGWGFGSCEYRWLCRIPCAPEEAEVLPSLYREAPWEPWYGEKGDWEGLSTEKRAELEFWTEQNGEFTYESA
jgi:hypothetical protein